MRNVVIIISVVAVLGVITLVSLMIWHSKACSDRFEKAVESENRLKQEATQRLQREAPEINQEIIYADTAFENMIKIYEDIARDCSLYAQTVRDSAERLRKARERAIELKTEEENERIISEFLGIEPSYLKNFPEGARLTYFKSSSDTLSVNFSDWTCSNYTSVPAGELSDVYMVDLKSPLEKGPADFFITTKIIIPAKAERYRYLSIERLEEGETPDAAKVYMSFSLPEYIKYKNRQIFFKMTELESHSGKIAIIDPLEKTQGDRLKLLVKDLLVSKKWEQGTTGRVSLEINIVCHTLM